MSCKEAQIFRFKVLAYNISSKKDEDTGIVVSATKTTDWTDQGYGARNCQTDIISHIFTKYGWTQYLNLFRTTWIEPEGFRKAKVVYHTDPIHTWTLERVL